MTIEDITRNTDFSIPQSRPVDIKVIGVGGGGNNAVRHMYEQGIKDVSFVICNTDLQALVNSPVPTKLMIGPTVTKGKGAGNKPEVARAAAEESVNEINALFDDETRMVFITAGMGGGTGTGAAPVVAQLARERGLLTIGIVTIPFLFEGQKKILKALEGADEMSKYVDALLVINNERLTEIYPDLQFMNAFGKADDTLSIAARGISELITANGVINIDFNDVDTTLRNGGAAVISLGYGEGENRVTKAINDALNSPLLKDRDIFGSKRILFNIYFNPNAEQEFVMREANELTDFISNIDPSVDVIWGLAHDESLGNKVKITLLAAGFDISARSEEQHIISSRQSSDDTPVVRDNTAHVDNTSKITELYGDQKTDVIFKPRETQKHIILTPDQFNDDSIIETFEKTPTFARERKVVEEIRNTAAKKVDQAQSQPKPVDQPAGEAKESKSEGQSRPGTRIDFLS